MSTATTDVEDEALERGRSPWHRLLVLLVALVVVGTVVVAWPRADPAPLPQAIALAADAGNFASGDAAAVTLARISELVEADARACAGSVAGNSGTRRPGLDDVCDARFALAAWTRVAAVSALGCTAPGRAEVRASVRAHLDILRQLEHGGDPVGEDLPRLPDCARPVRSG